MPPDIELGQKTPTVDELISRGQLLEDGGDFEGALRAYSEAVRMSPRSPRAHLNLGNALVLLRRPSEAEAAFEASIEILPDYAEGHMNLGNLFLTHGHFFDAAASYREAIRLRPGWVEAIFGLGCALVGDECTEEAVATFKSVLHLDPTHGKAAASLADVLGAEDQSLVAREILQRVIDGDPGNVPALIALATIDRRTGDCDSAAVSLRTALTHAPKHRDLSSNYLFALQFLPGISAAQILSEHRRVVAQALGMPTRMLLNNVMVKEKRLRIGYVSPDFRRHPVSCFFEPLLRHHDRTSHEVVCYYNHTQSDEITVRFKALADRWRDIASMSDESLAQCVVDDGIDILIDLAGHTTGNRLGAFALKPAPIQMTWLGYLGTTGLDAIDYRLCDRYTDPENIAEDWQVETPARLADSQWCYQPQTALPECSALPMLTNGYWTFGSFNQASKINPNALKIWASALMAIPRSRLRIFGVDDALTRARIVHVMSQEGIDADRIDVIGRIPIELYFEGYRDVDVALDTFPYNGATTTCDALIMGVPVATIMGERSIARGGVSLLSTLGLEEWIAPSASGFPSMLLERLHDPAHVAELRADLPARMRKSALMDGARFVRNLEDVYRAAWVNTCNLAN